MYTAVDALIQSNAVLDEKIERAVLDGANTRCGSIRVYDTDWFCNTVQEELELRGFKNVQVPRFVQTADVYFEW